MSASLIDSGSALSPPLDEAGKLKPPLVQNMDGSPTPAEGFRMPSRLQPNVTLYLTRFRKLRVWSADLDGRTTRCWKQEEQFLQNALHEFDDKS